MARRGAPSPRSGPLKGRVYVRYQDSRIANSGTQPQTGGFGNFVANANIGFSDDQGVTWSEPIPVAGGGHAH